MGQHAALVWSHTLILGESEFFIIFKYKYLIYYYYYYLFRVKNFVMYTCHQILLR
jgi:hypothetical protein